VSAVPLPGARRHVFAITYGQPPDPAATTRLLDVLERVASSDGEAAAAHKPAAPREPATAHEPAAAHEPAVAQAPVASRQPAAPHEHAAG
jgi:hypothetical protein